MEEEMRAEWRARCPFRIGVLIGAINAANKSLRRRVVATREIRTADNYSLPRLMPLYRFLLCFCTLLKRFGYRGDA